MQSAHDCDLQVIVPCQNISERLFCLQFVWRHWDQDESSRSSHAYACRHAARSRSFNQRTSTTMRTRATATGNMVQLQSFAIGWCNPYSETNHSSFKFIALQVYWTDMYMYKLIPQENAIVAQTFDAVVLQQASKQAQTHNKNTNADSIINLATNRWADQHEIEHTSTSQSGGRRKERGQLELRWQGWREDGRRWSGGNRCVIITERQGHKTGIDCDRTDPLNEQTPISHPNIAPPRPRSMRLILRQPVESIVTHPIRHSASQNIQPVPVTLHWLWAYQQRNVHPPSFRIVVDRDRWRVGRWWRYR